MWKIEHEVNTANSEFDREEFSPEKVSLLGKQLSSAFTIFPCGFFNG
jgi:hypothetical protein